MYFLISSFEECETYNFQAELNTVTGKKLWARNDDWSDIDGVNNVLLR